MSARSEEKRNLAPCIHDIVNTIRVKRNYRYVTKQTSTARGYAGYRCGAAPARRRCRHATNAPPIATTTTPATARSRKSAVCNRGLARRGSVGATCAGADSAVAVRSNAAALARSFAVRSCIAGFSCGVRQCGPPKPDAHRQRAFAAGAVFSSVHTLPTELVHASFAKNKPTRL